MKSLVFSLILALLLGNLGTSILANNTLGYSIAEATVVSVNDHGYKVDIDDSSIYVYGKGHVNVVITPYYARWNPSYLVEAIWNDDGYVVYRLDNNGNRKICNGNYATESEEFTRAIVGYLASCY